MNNKIKLDKYWLDQLKSDFESEYFSKLKEFLIEEKTKYQIYPPGNEIFNAFNLCPFNKTKVVIIGQDPYHNPGQAHGLCFSVRDGVDFPPSLRNITKELIDDVGINAPINGDLTNWAKQGVLLLNATLTVRKKQAGSHQKKGWETFTDSAIKKVSDNRENVVFLLWGNYARSKKKIIDTDKHLILEAVHPSPLSAHRGFFGCKHFSKTNKFLKQNGLEQINWQFG